MQLNGFLKEPVRRKLVMQLNGFLPQCINQRQGRAVMQLNGFNESIEDKEKRSHEGQ